MKIAWISVAVFAIYLLLANPVIMDDGFHYEGFAEDLARGHLNFKDYYGFQGLSFFTVPIYWLTHSSISIIYTSMIFALLSIPLSYGIGKLPAVILFLLTPYPYMTMMRGFQESALMFFILLIIYGAIHEKKWTGIAWGISGVVKPFALVLFPLFKKRFTPLIIGVAILAIYGIANYAQTGHFVNLAATGAYSGVYDPSNVPELGKSFALDIKTWLRLGANLFVPSRKIMIAPLLVFLGALSLWQTRREPWSRKVIYAVFLNILLVGPITYAFSKYLLPMTVLLGLSAIPLLLRYPILWAIVFVDSIWVFSANYDFFGKNFWDPSIIALAPFVLAAILCIYYVIAHNSSDAQRIR